MVSSRSSAMGRERRGGLEGWSPDERWWSGVVSPVSLSVCPGALSLKSFAPERPVALGCRPALAAPRLCAPSLSPHSMLRLVTPTPPLLVFYHAAASHALAAVSTRSLRISAHCCWSTMASAFCRSLRASSSRVARQHAAHTARHSATASFFVPSAPLSSSLLSSSRFSSSSSLSLSFTPASRSDRHAARIHGSFADDLLEWTELTAPSSAVLLR